MVIKKFTQGQSVKQIILETGALLCVASDTTGISTEFDFADVKNDLAEITPLVATTFKSEGESVFECDNTRVILAGNGDLYMSIVGDVEQ